MRTVDYIVIGALITQAILNFYILRTNGAVVKWMGLQIEWNQRHLARPHAEPEGATDGNDT